MAPQVPKARTTVVLALAFVLERLDEMLLSAVYEPLGASLRASPSQLGALTLCRALLQVGPCSAPPLGVHGMATCWQLQPCGAPAPVCTRNAICCKLAVA